MIDKLKNWLNNRRKAAAERREKERRQFMSKRFTITENGGNVFIMCEDTAILRIAPNETIATLLVQLNKAREAAALHK